MMSYYVCQSCGTEVNHSSIQCLKNQLAAMTERAEKAEAASKSAIHAYNEIRKAMNQQAETITYLTEHHDECHQPAANYELLLCKLRGEPTNHGNCRVAKKLDQQAEEITRLREAIPKTADGVQIVLGMTIYGEGAEPICVGQFRILPYTTQVMVGPYRMDGQDFMVEVNKCYSTHKAALATAKENTDG